MRRGARARARPGPRFDAQKIRQRSVPPPCALDRRRRLRNLRPSPPGDRARSLLALAAAAIGKATWRRWCSAGERPEDIPSLPSREYAGQGWVGWVDWLGNELAEGEECAICLNPFHRKGHWAPARLRGCGHRFHRGCIDNWRAQGDAKTCPHCRGPLG